MTRIPTPHICLGAGFPAHKRLRRDPVVRPRDRFRPHSLLDSDPPMLSSQDNRTTECRPPHAAFGFEKIDPARVGSLFQGGA